MMKNLMNEISKSYIINDQIFIASSNPTDVRQTCNSVQDFQEIAALGLELRYNGMISFEESTKRWKGCIKNDDGTFKWIDLTSAIIGEVPEHNHDNRYALKEHEHEEYLPKVSLENPSESIPNGAVWINID